MVVTEHELEVPLDHARPDGEKLTVFAREVADTDGRDKPFLVYFEGAPATRRRAPPAYPPARAGSTAR